METVCAHCGRPGEALPRCTGCWTVRYCSPDCQRRHWPSHKGTCSKRPGRSARGGQGTEREKDDLKGKTTTSSSAQGTPLANQRKGGEEEVDVSSASQKAAPVYVCKTCKTTSSTAVKCTRCQEVTYCSRDCRRADWLTHMDTCVPAHPTKEVHGKTEHAVSGDDDGVTSSNPHDHPPKASGGKQTGEKDCPTSRPDLTAEEEDDPDVKTCQNCKTKTKSMKRCGRCLDVTYCSRDCQSADWRAHKVTCQPVEVVTTEGYRETLRKEQAAREETANRLANLLFHSRLFTGTPGDLSWQEARSRASRLFPFQRIVDDFERLDSDFMGLPFRLFPSWMGEGRGAGVVALGRLTTPYFHPFRPARGVEDLNGMSVYVIFYTGEPPWPYFQYSQLREGNYICIQEAFLHLFADGSVGFRIEDVSDVRIIESTP